MSDILKLKASNCKNCYRCIRNCPVKSIKFSDNQAHIVNDECILCGKCYVSCPQHAKELRNDIYVVKELLNSGKKVYASIAPSFISNYDGINIKTLEKALKSLGFYAAEETAIGATIVKNKYEKMLQEEKRNVIISSCCHTINLLIQRHYPKALTYLADVISPMQAHAIDIKNREPEAKVVFVGPCISKKDEVEKYPGIVDVAITFSELTEWLKKEKIEFEPENENVIGGRARHFPTTGGILKSMNCDLDNYNYISIDGVDNSISAIEDIINGKIINCFVEMSACIGSCIGGPARDRKESLPVKDYLAVERYARKNDFIINDLNNELIKKEIRSESLYRKMPDSVAIEEILRKMGKYKPEDELNCGSCGYNTCRDKAIAVYMGMADLTMCLPYLKEKAESFSDNIITNTPNGIIVLNESLEIQQVNNAACDILNIKNSDSIIGEQVVTVLNPQEFIQVLYDNKIIRDKKVYLAEYQKYVEETIIYDKNYNIIIGIMKDITSDENDKLKKKSISEQTIQVTDKVIEKQMRVVQEIASLLGETTAETKVALTKLKESLENG